MKKQTKKIIGSGLLLLEAALLFSLFSFYINSADAAIGDPDANVETWLKIDNVYPDIMNVSLNYDSAVTLTPNATTRVDCIAVIRDYNGDDDISLANATLYDATDATSTSADDNNNHYTNASCELIADTNGFNGYPANSSDEPYYSLANCTFDVEYYANASTNWVCNVTVEDSRSWSDTKWRIGEISELMALGLPDMINYTTINATYVSDEKTAQVTNFGNVQINLSLEGYAQSEGDGYAMNCTLGNVGYIDIEHEKYNLTSSNTIDQSLLSAANAVYENLTSSAVVKTYELASRTNDATNDAYDNTYWRIYVPKGVAGYCTGHIIFGATTGVGAP